MASEYVGIVGHEFDVQDSTRTSEIICFLERPTTTIDLAVSFGYNIISLSLEVIMKAIRNLAIRHFIVHRKGKV